MVIFVHLSSVKYCCVEWYIIVTHTRLTALSLGLPRWAHIRKVKQISILLKQETVSGSGITWAMCKSALCSRQTPMPVPDHSVFTGWTTFLLPNQQHQSTDSNTYLWSYSKYPKMCGTLFDNSDRQIRTHTNDDIFQLFTQLEQQHDNSLDKQHKWPLHNSYATTCIRVFVCQ